MEKIIIKLQGGLGNQMFQYATGLALSIKYKVDLIIDKSFYTENNKCTERHYQLNVFNIEEKFINNRIIKETHGIIYSKLKKIINKLDFKKNIFLKIIKIILIKITKIISKETKEKNFNKINKKKYIHLSGYFQNEKYFLNIKKEIQKNFEIKKELLSDTYYDWLKKIKNNNSTSIHVRRGDYISNKKNLKKLGFIGIDYYKKAINLILQKQKNQTFFIFSDDINWCKNNFNFIKNNIYYIEGLKNYEDLNLMKNCKHNIIANSSFSWWGGWLNKNEKKIVISPKKWFNQQKKIKRQSKNWIKI
ncbi:alpha-1,2-fucosyltransferase [bacterium]|nr:alpha-1,2-fucosyltransferase [bacterium]